MKPIWIIFIIVILICIGLYLVFQMRLGKTPTPATSVAQPTQMNNKQQESFCLSTQLKASIEPQGEITIKNISQTTCQVIGNNALKVEYPTSVQNFQIVQKGKPEVQVFTLAPNQVIYSLIHFPNGSQCSSKATNITTFVTYNFSRKDILIFSSNRGNIIMIPSCEKVSEKTQIDLYPFSTNKVTL